MPNYYNIRTGETLTQEEFSALICDADYDCCNQYANVWMSGNVAKNEYQWQQYFIENNLCSDGNVPVNIDSPDISGTVGIGNTLTTTNGTWTSDSGVTSYTYQWTRNGTDIVGATNSTYSIVALDMDANIRCKVRAFDSDGGSLPATSNAILIPIYWGVTGGTPVYGTATNNVYA